MKHSIFRLGHQFAESLFNLTGTPVTRMLGIDKAFVAAMPFMPYAVALAYSV